MTIKNKIRLLFPAFLLCVFWSNASAQIDPEITLGAKYIGKDVVSTYGKDYALVPELGTGVNFNDKWYTGIISYYYSENGIHDEQEWKSKFTSLEFEFRRSFNIPLIPRFVPYLTAKPGIMIWHYSTTENESNIRNSITLISSSVSAGLYYKVSENLKVSLSYGLSRTANKEAFFNLNYKGFSTILDAGISYIF